jgi:hypothetical protein
MRRVVPWLKLIALTNCTIRLVVTLPLFDESHNRGSYAASPCWAASQFFSNVMGLT